MLSAKLSHYARDRYEARRKLLGPVIDRADAAIAATGDEDEATLLRYLYGTLPVTDCLDVAPRVLLSFVRHALMLRRDVAWTRELGEGMFVHYVMCPRINSEPMLDSRPTFWGLLRERVAGLTPYEAVREVNYWCCEMATYQTTDDRSLNPLAMLGSGYGRCGEESTFLVTALRSIGIPARQIYTPWWAHCDDNHAWVEAFTGDDWHYLGACEPEEELDRGWFTNASGRALMEETRMFSDYRDDSVTEQDSGSVGSTRLLNVTDSYAISQPLEIEVMRDDKPVCGATVSVEVLNMAAWRAAATVLTDERGHVTLQLGLATLRVHAAADGLVASVDVDTRSVHEATLELSEPAQALPELGEWHDIDVAAPADNPAPSHAMTSEQAARTRERKAAADELRRSRVGAFQAHAAELAKRWPAAGHAFEHALANADQIARFLSLDDEPDRLEMLGTLTDKDFCDVRATMLESHLAHARQVREAAEHRLREQGLDEKAAHETYVSAVMCPRSSYEDLSDWRPYILAHLPLEQRLRFAEQPREVWAWLEDCCRFDGREGLTRPIGTPMSVILSGIAATATRGCAFVAICRTLGVAARLNPETSHPEFMEGGRFVPVEEPRVPKTSRVTVSCPDPANAPAYFTSWSIGRLEAFLAPNSHESVDFRDLDLTGSAFTDGRLDLELEDGTYRVITTTRLPSGDQQASELVFTLADGHAEGLAADGDGFALTLRHREPSLEDMLNVIELPAFELADGEGKALVPALGGNGRGILAFVEQGMEPTEHLLNELRERADDVRAAELSVTLVARDATVLSDPTLTRTLKALPEVTVAYDDFTELPERLARRTYANPELMPLALLLAPGKDGGLESLYATAGYNVGTVDLLLRLATIRRD